MSTAAKADDPLDSQPRPPPRRAIGPIGTVARVVVGGLILADVVTGHAANGWHIDAWALGLIVFPAAVLTWQSARARRRAAALRATGPIAHVVNLAVFVALYLFEPTSDAALIFYGASMLVTAARGCTGCEILAVSNWILRRDDRVGCAVFLPIDAMERVAHDDDPGRSA